MVQGQALSTVKILAVVSTSLVAVAGLMWATQRKLIYFPTQTVGTATAISIDSEKVTFTTDDGLTLSAWWVPATEDPNGTTIVVFHGNGGNRTDRAPLARALAQRGYGVLLMDYRGYGGNPGSPSEAGLLLDAKAAVAYAISRHDVDPDKLVYFGESLGAAVAIAVAQERPPAALILRSPFTSLTDVASVHYPYAPTALLRDRYLNVETIRKVDVPLLVLAGSQDTIIPIAQSREVFDAASGPKRFVTVAGTDHNDLELAHGPVLIEAVATFLEGIAASS